MFDRNKTKTMGRKWLSWVAYWYNTNYYSATKMISLKALYVSHPQH